MPDRFLWHHCPEWDGHYPCPRKMEAETDKNRAAIREML